MVDAPNLWVEIAAYRGTSSNVRLHDITNDFDGLAILEYRWVIICLLDDRVPLKLLALCRSWWTTNVLLGLDKTLVQRSAALAGSFGPGH